MSKVKIEGNASGSGTLTISAPNTNTDRTINLPDDDITLAAFPDAIDVNASAPADSLNIDASGNVGIGTSSPSTYLEVVGGTLGGTSGDKLDLLNLRHTNPNGAHLTVEAVRTASTNNWENAATRIQHKIDSTDQAYIQFNGTGNTYGLSFGTNTADEAMRITSDGRGLSQFTAKAWIKLHQGNNSIYDSHNVSSITHPENGHTLVNFANSMGYTNYCAVASSGYFYYGNCGVMDFYSGSLRVVNAGSSSYTDTAQVNVVVFGD